MKAYAKQQDEIQHSKWNFDLQSGSDSVDIHFTVKKFIASAGTYANLVKQAKSKQKVRPLGF